RVRARKLLENEYVREKVRSGAAVLLGDARAHQPQLGELREDVARECVFTVPRSCVRLDPLACEIPGQRLDLTLVLRELEVHEPECSQPHERLRTSCGD